MTVWQYNPWQWQSHVESSGSWTTTDKLHSEGPSSSSVRLSRGLLDDLSTIVGCRSSNGLSKGKVRVQTPQSLLDAFTCVASMYTRKKSVILSVVSELQ